MSKEARIQSLDGIRGAAALWVFATHATYAGLLPPILNFRGAGRGGVVLFFFLSAYLLSGPFLRNPRTGLTWQSWATYWVRRFFRIVPLYYLVLIALFLVGASPFNALTSSDRSLPSLLIQHLSFQKGLSVFWTIIVEVRFYVVLPFLIMLMAAVRRTLKAGRLLLLLIGFLWIMCVAFGVIEQGTLRTLGIDKHAPIFITGLMTAFLACDGRFDSNDRKMKILYECLAWLSGIGFICLAIPALYYALTLGHSIAAFSASSPVYEAFWNERIPWIGLVLAVFFFSYPRGVGLMRRCLCWVALTWVGRISYGFYLIHLSVIGGFERMPLPAGLRPILILGTSLGVCWLLYKVLEQPLIALGHRLTAKYIDAGNGQKRDSLRNEHVAPLLSRVSE
jgi:peptidoglycan/LPS O-acetylase OafA/YrhL